LGHNLSPRGLLLFVSEPFLGGVIQQADLDPASNDRGKVSVSEGTTDDGLRLGNVVELSEGSRVSVGVALKVVRRGKTVVRLGDGPERSIRRLVLSKAEGYL